MEDGGWSWRRTCAGLHVGMPASKAQALVQGLVIQDANPAADAEALERLALWMLQRFAPIVAADPPDGIVIDSAGADHLHGGEAATLAILVEKPAGVGLRARATIADTWGAAYPDAQMIICCELAAIDEEHRFRDRLLTTSFAENPVTVAG
jgi:hypothetical protein